MLSKYCIWQGRTNNSGKKLTRTWAQMKCELERVVPHIHTEPMEVSAIYTSPHEDP